MLIVFTVFATFFTLNIMSQIDGIFDDIYGK